MHTSEKTARAAEARHLQENLRTQLAKGREWATPGIETALHRALTGIDSGIEAASPRVQASLRRIADELAGGVEAVTPRLHDRIALINPKANALAAARAAEAAEAIRKSRNRRIAGVAAAAAICGVALWRALQPVGEPSTALPPETTPEDDTTPGEPSAATPV
ncbi:MAG: hypothetical protein JWO49_2698 [Arthrobacter sp.]|nr:hypothetical protein [Arthrobacter sp.]